jgi:hypothetical protein
VKASKTHVETMSGAFYLAGELSWNSFKKRCPQRSTSPIATTVQNHLDSWSWSSHYWTLPGLKQKEFVAPVRSRYSIIEYLICGAEWIVTDVKKDSAITEIIARGEGYPRVTMFHPGWCNELGQLAHTTKKRTKRADLKPK